MPNGLVNGKQAFENTEAGVYLYFLQLTPCKTFWTVGPNLGGAASIAHIQSTEDDVTNVNGSWKILVNGVWMEDIHTNVFCL